MAGDSDDLLPQNATEFEKSQSKTSSRLLATDTDTIRRQRDALRCSVSFLPLLAAERSVHLYAGPVSFSDDFTEEFVGTTRFRRNRTQSSFVDHLSYGTPAALEKEISEDVGLPIRIVEWFEDPALEFPEFIVECDIDVGEPVPTMEGVLRAAVFRKNVRDWPVKARVKVNQPAAALYVGAASHMSSAVTIWPFDAPPPPKQIFVGVATRAISVVTISPMRTL